MLTKEESGQSEGSFAGVGRVARPGVWPRKARPHTELNNGQRPKISPPVTVWAVFPRSNAGAFASGTEPPLTPAFSVVVTNLFKSAVNDKRIYVMFT